MAKKKKTRVSEENKEHHTQDQEDAIWSPTKQKSFKEMIFISFPTWKWLIYYNKWSKENFHQFQKVISILGDEEKMTLHDQAGCLDDAVTEADAKEFETNYRGSNSEVKDLKDLYQKCKGKLKQLELGNETCAAIASDLGIKVGDKVTSEAGFSTEIDEQMNVFSNGFGSDVGETITGYLTNVDPLMETPFATTVPVDQCISNDNGNCSDLAEPIVIIDDFSKEGTNLSPSCHSNALATNVPLGGLTGESDNMINSLAGDNVLCDGV
ncbi:hypothetical protein NE237_018561 [Protea cynaroides]|uniref:Uncharacterized protein n=1 Tax=Protea cynaroides TaxID=273540 RepID=A0A9Q0KA71_9MAGN|nr:hypothetical protein NE237_018561 [Protea cynaroides]